MRAPMSLRDARGFTILELLIGLAVGLIIAFAAGTMLVSSTKLIGQQDMLAAAEEDAQVVYKIIADLVTMAEICPTCVPATSLDVVYPSGLTNPNPNDALYQQGDAISITGLLPAGYKVWPNVTANTPAVRLVWNASSGALTLATAANVASLSGAATQNLAIVSAKTPRIVNIDLWPLDINGVRLGSVTGTPAGGYDLCVVTRVPTADPGFVNSDDAGALHNVRTSRVCGVIFPRNLL